MMKDDKQYILPIEGLESILYRQDSTENDILNDKNNQTLINFSDIKDRIEREKEKKEIDLVLNHYKLF